MKRTLLGLLATAMLITACQKEAAAPTNEATLVPKCLEGEFIATTIYGAFIMKVTNAKIGNSWKPTSECNYYTNDGKIVDFKNKTIDNVIELTNGLKIFSTTKPPAIIDGTGLKLYFTIDSTSIGNVNQCLTFPSVVSPEYWCEPSPSIKFCATSISTTKCK